MSRLLEWQNLVFVLALVLAGVLVLGAALGLVSAEVDADADVHVEADHDVPAAVLAVLGVGRAPLSLLLVTGLVTFGAAGICSNLVLEPWLGSHWARGAADVFAASIAAVVVTGTAARVFARFIPSLESYATEVHDVIGVTGVAEIRIDGGFGVARVRDRTGTSLQIRCCAHAVPIPKGTEIVVVDFDDERRLYTVDTTAPQNGDQR